MTAPLDAVLPDFAYRTRNETTVAAPLEATWTAMRTITPADLPLTRTLTAMRGAPGKLLGNDHGGPADAPDRPVVEQFEEAGFNTLSERAPQILLAGTATQPWRLRGADRVKLAGPAEFRAFDRPGYVRIAMSFELTPNGTGGTQLATETRVSPTDAAAARAFSRYWTAIRLGSVAIRLDLLRGIRRRAERTRA